MRYYRLCFYSEESCHDGTLAIIKAECTRVVHKEVDKAVDDDVAQSSGGVISVAFHDNVFTSLNLSFATWAAGGEKIDCLCTLHKFVLLQ